MANRASSLQRCLIGKEVTAGTGVDPTIELKSIKTMPSADIGVDQIAYTGSLLDGATVRNRESATISVDGKPDYNELGYLLSMIIGKPSTELVTTGVYRHEFDFDPRGKADLQSYSCEYGDSSFHEKVIYMVLSALSLTLNRNENNLSGSGFSRKLELFETGTTVGLNCVQTVTPSGSPTGGTFKLRWKGQTTAAIAYNATGATIESDLEALSNIGSGGVSVSGSATGPWTVTFSGGDLAGEKHELIEVVDLALTGGTSPSVAVTMTTEGGHKLWPVAPMSVRDYDVFYADTLDGLPSGILEDCFQVDWSLSDRIGQRYVIGSANESYKDFVEKKAAWQVNFEVQADARARTIKSHIGDNQLHYVRLLAESELEIETGSNYALQFDMAVHVTGQGAYSDNEGDYATRLETGVRYDPAWGRAAKLVLTNAVDAY